MGRTTLWQNGGRPAPFCGGRPRRRLVIEHQFSWGAHLLLWVFPLLLVVTALTLHLLGGRRPGSRP